MQKLRDDLRKFASDREWDQFHDPKNLAMALAVEVAELMEHFQWLSSDESENLPSEALAAVRHELGDVLIYLVRLSDRLGVDLLRLLVNSETSVTTMDSYWKHTLTEYLPIRLNEFFNGNFVVDEIDNYTFYCHSSMPFALFARHPLLSEDCRDVIEGINLVRGHINNRIESVVSFSIYDFIRNPLRVCQRIRSSLNEGGIG